MAGSGADAVANAIFDVVMTGVDSIDVPDVDLTGVNFQLPDPTNLSAAITHLSNDDLTTGDITGTGAFDILMKGFNAHLKREFDAQRITGEYYAKAYIELTQSAMAQAVQFLLGKDAAYWAAITAQQNALAAQASVITARLQMETAKMELITTQAKARESQAAYALTKLKLATEDKTYGAAAYTLEYILPEQQQLLSEQGEAARAQTMDTRSDGVTSVVGILGSQKNLYNQQITSYQRDSEVKASKIFVDAWTVMKTIDEGLTPPTNFANAVLDDILTTLITANNLEPPA